MLQHVTIPKALDVHVHLRTGDMLRSVAPYTARHFRHALVMPNTRPEAVTTPYRLCEYAKEILAVTGDFPDFRPLMTFEVREDTDPVVISRFKQAEAAAGKVYPYGLTTNADHGVRDYAVLAPVLAEMEKHDLVLCLHGEQPGYGIEGLERETEFLKRTLPFIATQFPRLRIVMEHITTRQAVEAVLRWPNVAATITVHHLLLRHDDVGGDRMCPHHYCKPVAKTQDDKEWLIRAATWGHPKFFFGSDSAPHHRDSKMRGMDCCAGIFSAPVALPLLVQIFEEHGAIRRLPNFIESSARAFYRLSTGSASIVIVRRPWTVPEEIDGIVPFKAGETLSWMAVDWPSGLPGTMPESYPLDVDTIAFKRI